MHDKVMKNKIKIFHFNSKNENYTNKNFVYSVLSAMGRPMMNNLIRLKSITMNKKGGASCLILN